MYMYMYTGAVRGFPPYYSLAAVSFSLATRPWVDWVAIFVIVSLFKKDQSSIHVHVHAFQTVTVNRRTTSVFGSRAGRNDTTTTSLAFPAMTTSSPRAWQSSTPVAYAGYWDTTTRYVCTYVCTSGLYVRTYVHIGALAVGSGWLAGFNR